MAVERYRIVQPVVLGFIVDDQGQDVLVDAGMLEVAGGVLTLVNERGRFESHTESGAARAWQATGHVEAIA